MRAWAEAPARLAERLPVFVNYAANRSLFAITLVWRFYEDSLSQVGLCGRRRFARPLGLAAGHSRAAGDFQRPGHLFQVTQRPESRALAGHYRTDRRRRRLLPNRFSN